MGEKRDDVKVRKEGMNKLVINYFVTEGFVAEKFRQESGTKHRMLVKKVVLKGNVQEANEKVNDLNPEILDTNLIYSFIDSNKDSLNLCLIRQHDIHKASKFSKEELAPRGEEHMAFLAELERTVAVFIFDDVYNSPLKYLINPALARR